MTRLYFSLSYYETVSVSKFDVPSFSACFLFFFTQTRALPTEILYQLNVFE